MTAFEYVAANSAGPHAPWIVPDLTPGPGHSTGLIFLFESPHSEEIKSQTRVPVIGKSGRDALAYLLGGEENSTGSLGRLVLERQHDDDFRISVMNVCNLPLLRRAFVAGNTPSLTHREWEQIRLVRVSRSKDLETMRSPDARLVALALLDNFQRRFDAVGKLDNYRLVVCGKFAMRYASRLRGIARDDLVEVPHPSHGRWLRRSNAALPGLLLARSLFASYK